MQRDYNSSEESSVLAPEDEACKGQDGLSSLAIGYAWVVRITTLCFEFAALLLLGRFVDIRFGFEPWGLLVGSFIGFYVFGSGLFLTIKRLEKAEEREKADKRT